MKIIEITGSLGPIAPKIELQGSFPTKDLQGCIKPPKLIFYPPRHLRKSFFYPGCNIWWLRSGIQHFVAAVGYKFK